MKEMSGYDFLKHIRKKGIISPVLIISMLASPDAIIEAFKEGAIDYLPKPFSLRDFTAKVREAVDRDVKKP